MNYPVWGELPHGWDLRRVWQVAESLDSQRRSIDGESRELKKGIYPYWGASGVIDHIDDYLFDEELVLVSEDSPMLRENLGKVVFRVTGKIWVGTHMHVLRAREGVLPSFLEQVLSCVDYSPVVEETESAKLTISELLEVQIPVPPLSVQRQISSNLQEQSDELDSISRGINLLTELLQEKKKVLISTYLTEGLHNLGIGAAKNVGSSKRGVGLKESSHPWFETVPPGWEVTKFERVCDILQCERGPNYPKPQETQDYGIPFIGPKNIRNGKIVFRQMDYLSEEKYKKLKTGKVKHNDLVVVMRGYALGNSALFKSEEFSEGFVDSQMMIFRPKETILPEFLLLFTRSNSFLEQVRYFSYGAAQPQITKEGLERIVLCLPPMVEQVRIADGLEVAIKEIDEIQKSFGQLKTLVRKKEKSIFLRNFENLR